MDAIISGERLKSSTEWRGNSEKSTIFHFQFFMGRRSLKKLGVPLIENKSYIDPKGLIKINSLNAKLKELS